MSVLNLVSMSYCLSYRSIGFMEGFLYVDVIFSILAFFQVKILNLFHALIITDFLSLFLVILYPYVFFFIYILFQSFILSGLRVIIARFVV